MIWLPCLDFEKAGADKGHLGHEPVVPAELVDPVELAVLQQECSTVQAVPVVTWQADQEEPGQTPAVVDREASGT